ncbi:hypothetical protein OC834_002158 [Tilletia horrida]|uniref:RRM domain-containing protein n=1 Tax=Tilletia horrida TaxID=155126 RepID=A0AAN6GEF8_9BASI|nr:hypothetical protein OC835_003930 [Tilletia horrida]KAK0533619.1 hypothetical protein OC834_002158 [Tilletia horrida]KAK0537067.1 hypothetical protein OC842_001763 [Tilletia horrida]
MADSSAAVPAPVAVDATAAAAPAAASPAPVTPAANPEEAKKQVFVGNLAFATTEADLKSLFSEAGSVAHAQIITRGTRSLGYAFVTFASEADATNAVQLLNKREVAGREINVEGAKPQSATPKAAAAGGGANGDDAAAAAGGARRGGSGGARGGRGSGRGSGRGGRGGASSGRTGGSSSSAAAAAGGAGGAGARRPPRSSANKEDGAAPTGEPSQTLIFVANLPFSTDDDGLKAAFANYKITSAFVAKRFGRKSKGYGFVDAESHEEQQRIIEEGKGLTIGDREVQLRVALNKADSGAAAAGGADEEGAADPAAALADGVAAVKVEDSA